MTSFNLVIVKVIFFYLFSIISFVSSIKHNNINLLNLNKTSIKLTQHNNHANISQLLDNLLRGYDNSVRPDFGGPPAIVEVDIVVRSMGPISEVDMTYSMDCYFRQSWLDKRLAFKGAQDTLALSISMLARIWKPDTYFSNGKQSYFHTITTPNKFVRIHQDGRVLYSSRLTIKAGCPMNLEDFPMDIQRCPLKFGSFGYTSKDVIYKWNGAREAVTIAQDMKLSQFDLVHCPTGNVTYRIPETNVSLSAEFSMLLVNFHLQRHMGNFLIQVYGPCILLVVLSWVSFWLNREATADRVSLGITTVLTMTFLGLEARKDLPKVPYPTALDFFVFLSFVFIFATIIQFAIVHYFTKYGSGECYFGEEFLDDADDDDYDTVVDTIEEEDVVELQLPTNSMDNFCEVIPLSMGTVIKKSHKRLFCMRNRDKGCPAPRRFNAATPTSLGSDSNRFTATPKSVQFKENSRVVRRRTRTPRFNSVSKIDRSSRLIFPILFVLINTFYWYAYLTRSERLYGTLIGQ